MLCVAGIINGKLVKTFCCRIPFLEVTSGNNSLNLIFSVMIPEQGKGRHSICTCSPKQNLVVIGTGIGRTDRQTDTQN